VSGFVWWLEGDRSAGEHDEGEGGLGGVEAVGAVLNDVAFRHVGVGWRR